MTIINSLLSTLGIYTHVDSNKVLIIDTSHWTGLVNFDIAKSNGVKGVIIKAMDGIIPTKWFIENYAGAKKAGLLVGAYTWLYKSSILSAGRQARAFTDLIKQYPCDLPDTVDFEKHPSGNSVLHPDINDLYGFVIPYEDITGKKPMIYSGPYFWKSNGSPNSFWNKYDLWIANYGVANPMSVAPWNNNYKLWQFSDRIDGAKYGSTGEKMLDGNYFNGTIEELYTWAGISTAPAPPVEPPIVIPPVDKPATTLVNVNVRSGAGISYPIIAPSIPAGTKVRILEEQKDSTGNTWGRMVSGWSAIIYNGATYIQYDSVIVMPPVVESPPIVAEPPVPPILTQKIFEGEFAWALPRYVRLGPAIIAGSFIPKKVQPILYLNSGFWPWIKSLSNNREDVWNLFKKWDIGPTVGINDNNKLCYIPAAWSGNLVRIIKRATDKSGQEWISVDNIPINKPLPSITEVNHFKTPHLIHRMSTVNNLNQFIYYKVLADGTPNPWDSLNDPLLSENGELWLPADMFTSKAVTKLSLNVRSGPNKSHPISSTITPGISVFITAMSVDDENNIWGKIGVDRWICLKYGKISYTSWELL